MLLPPAHHVLHHSVLSSIRLRGDTGRVVGSDVPGRVHVGVEGAPPLLAAEVAPTSVIAHAPMPVTAALLARIAKIDRGDGRARQCRLVVCKVEQAGRYRRRCSNARTCQAEGAPRATMADRNLLRKPCLTLRPS